MAKRRRMRPEDMAEWCRRRLRDLPVGIPVDYFGELCERIGRCVEWGCQGDTHALVATREWIRFSDYSGRAEEVLAWLDSLGCYCDCSVKERGYRLVRRLFR